MFFLFNFFILLFHSLQSKYNCVIVEGKLLCNKKPQIVNEIQVYLYDYDPFIFDFDDKMGKTLTNGTGYFNISGCGEDSGENNQPDPYLLIKHYCTDNGKMGKTYIGLLPIFKPRRQNIGKIILDNEDYE
ncbi:Transthyretin-like family-containing protein [Strongyloides ratti]|uniref:Transthyretin-like family-containing protein n=1 Tax=Strongyloides ratti TaxID=34506 RepID=A0A090L3S4_STRRB|nr:Transthyretin-like family-containing protein [Strongyloides ratti]CEF64372.1 Transthyretin-like family-containing protein [Strongyloides ratti]